MPTGRRAKPLRRREGIAARQDARLFQLAGRHPVLRHRQRRNHRFDGRRAAVVHAKCHRLIPAEFPNQPLQPLAGDPFHAEVLRREAGKARWNAVLGDAGVLQALASRFIRVVNPGRATLGARRWGQGVLEGSRIDLVLGQPGTASGHALGVQIGERLFIMPLPS